MSNKYALFNAIMADRTLNPVAKNVAAILLFTFRNNKTGLCNPSFETIAECAGCGVRSANRAAMELKEAGWLDWTGTKGGGSGNTNQFRFILKTENSANLAHLTLPTTTVTLPTTTETLPSWHTNLLEPSIEPIDASALKNENEGRKKVAPQGGARGDDPSDNSQASKNEEWFEEFFRLYPLRAGDNPKAPAKQLFLSLTKTTDPAVIVAGLKGFAAETAANKTAGTRFIPHAARWLRDRSWEDYPAKTSDQVEEKLTMEKAIEQFKTTGHWSRYAPVSDIFDAPHDLLASYGLLPDGRKMPTIMVPGNIVFQASVMGTNGLAMRGMAE